MIRYIPEVILEHYQRKELSGSFNGFALLLDVADFTPISTEFQRHGKQGAEELSAFLDFVFGEPIRIVESCGGFVSLFAGDAFCAIFPTQGTLSTNCTSFPDDKQVVSQQPGDNAGHGVMAAVLEIARFFKDKTTYPCQCRDFALRIRQTVSFGEVFWQIYENDLQNEYVFFGEPLKALAELSTLKQALVFSADAANTLGMESFEPFADNAVLQKTWTSADTSKYPLTPSSRFQVDKAVHNRFLNPKYQQESPQPEIRSAAFCFANLEAIKPEGRDQAVSTLQSLANKYRGFVNKYEDTDKGFVGLILFGIPRSEDRTLERICNFSLEAVDSLPSLALGISCGSVIACYTGSETAREYTALGAPVNLASRLMSKARTGEVLSDTYLWQELHSSYDFSYLGSLTLKGIENSIGYYRLKRLSPTQHREESPFVGRETEIRLIREIADNCLTNRENAIIYITGDAGIGKSRLAAEALAVYGLTASETNRLCHTYKLTCDVILKKPLEAIKQLIRTHFYYNPLLPKEAGITMFRALWSTLSPGDREMQRIESFIAYLLDYEWEGSIWSMLPPEERPQQLKQAFIYYMKMLCETKPVIIHLDDGQWLDEDSQSYLQALSQAEIKPVIIISPCRYLDNGSKPELNLSKYKRIDLDLGSLSENGSSELIKNIMRLSKLPEATNELIQSRSMGNPLFIEQLSSYLLETGSVNDKGEIIKELGYLSTFSISDIIGSRIDRLTQSVKECLFGASVLGMEFDVRILSEMLKTDLKPELETGKDNLIWKEIKEIRYIFSHILIKDIAYQSMLSSKLKELHKLAAEAMETVYKDNLDEHAEEIGIQFQRAGFEEKAAEYFDKAGSWFKGKFVWDKSEHLLKNAMSIREKVLGAEHQDMAQSLNNLANLYHAQGKYAEAEPLFLKALAIRKKVLGEEHPDTAETLQDLAIVYNFQSKYPEAESLFLKALAIREKVLGAEHPVTAASLEGLANLYKSRGKYAEAESLFLKAIAIREKVLGEEHPVTASTLNYLAGLYNAQGKYTEAESLFLRALAIKERLLGEEHPGTAQTLNDLASLYHTQGKNAEAEALFIRALKIKEIVLGADHPEMSTGLNNLAVTYVSQGKYAEAEPFYLRSLAISEKALGTEHRNIVGLLNNLAVLYDTQGKYTEAEPYYLRSLAIFEKLLGTDHPDYSVLLGNLADFYKTQGKYTVAEPLCIRALEIVEKVLGAEHLDTAISLNNLASLYRAQGKYTEAEPLYLRSLTIMERVLGEEHPDTAQTLNNLASMYQTQDKYAEAEPLYLRALAIREKSLGAEHNTTASSLNNLASLYHAQGKYAEAEPYALRALKIREKKLGSEHPDTALLLNNLAKLYYNQGKYVEAENMYLRALSVFEKSLGIKHPSSVAIISYLVDIYEKMNQPEQAAQYKAMLPLNKEST